MTFGEWIAEPVNWAFLIIGVGMLFSAIRVVTSPNVVHAALYLVAALGGVAGLFVLLSAEFVALSIVLVYIGAVIVLFLFGIMITRAPTGLDTALDNPRKVPAALLSLVVFGLLSYASVTAFESSTVSRVGEPTETATLAEAFVGRFVVPFEIVGFILLAALVGGVTIARRDLTPLEEEMRRSV
ncbi:MAG TPA: NADH-quinone oxidoreductase subunit J [Acidimicrobiia bacterium]|nr:NADH-quinone oxidoreductase subunit J [Acidimicrobiia bacterium]